MCEIKEKELELLSAVILAATDPEDDEDDEELTREVRFYSGAPVARMDFFTGEKYSLAFSMDPAHVILDRLNNGAPLLNNHSSHDLADIVGVVESARLDGKSGRATVRFSNRPELKGIRDDVRNGIIRNISMGARVESLKDVTPDGAKQKSYLATKWEPMELSIVPIPADAGAGFLSHQQIEPNIDRATAQQETRVEQQLTGAEEQARIDAVRTETLAAERARVAAIGDLCRPFVAQLGDDFPQRLVAGGATVEDARTQTLARLAAATQADPSRRQVDVVRDQGETLRTGAENALLNRWRPGEIALDAGREFHGMSLLEMAKDFIGRSGRNTRGMPRHQVVELAFQGTTDFANVLANVFNKSLRMGYDAEPQTFGPIAKRGTIVDFKPVNRTQIGDVPTLTKLGPSGEYQYAKVTDAKETYSLATYGQIFAINRQVLINDDLGAFTRIPESQGRAARRMESDVIWGIVTANAAMGDGTTLFHATHGNLTGTGTVINVASLGVARQLMRVQKGLANVGYLNLTPKYLVVPTALETVAQQYTVQTNIIVTQQSNINPVGPTLTVVPEPRLDANSATAWYLFADPGMIDTIEYSYLEGQEGVYMETRMGFDVDGMELKVREDFAAKALDWRGMYKNVGA